MLYELGLAHTIGKPVIMVSESLQDIPFDLRALRVIDYDKNAPDWGEAFKAKIVQAITEVLAAPTESILSVFLETDEVESGSEVSPLERDVLRPCDRRWSPSSEVLHLVVPGHGYSSPTAKY